MSAPADEAGQAEKVRARRLAGLYSLSLRMGLGGVSNRLAESLYVYLTGSGMRVSPRGYAALVMLAPILVGATFLIVMPLAGIPAYVAAAASLSASILAALILYVLPALRFRNRGDRLEPRILLFEMFLLSTVLTSHSYLEALERLRERARMIGFDVELDEALKRVAIEGSDPPEAIGEAAKITPSRSLRSLFEGLRGIMESGMGIVEYIQWSISSHYSEVEARYRSALDTLSTIMEAYMALAVLAPTLGLIAVLTLYGFGTVISAPPVDPRLLVGAITFVLSPLTAIAAVIVIDSIISRLRP